MKPEKSLQELLEFGILNIDKPNNYTSFQTAEIVARILQNSGYKIRKFSHFGTLDPKVTGVLPIALNRSVKLTGWFMKKNKTYVGIMKIHKKISQTDLEKEMKKFVGKIMQKPPVKSRVKRQERQREVFSWDLLEYDQETGEALFETKVEAGTYIRKLISDMGENINGAHMLELRRTKAGIFSEKDKNFINLYYLEEIKDDEKELRKIIIPAEQAVKKIITSVKINPDEKRLNEILIGKPISLDELEKMKNQIKQGGEVAIFVKNRFIGIYIRENKNLKPKFVKN